MSSSNGSNDNTKLSDKEEAYFEKMLPWLVNGTLSDEEKNELESALNLSAKLRKEKEILLLLQQQVKQQEMPDVPIEFAWQQMKRQIADEKKQKTNNSNNSQNKWRYIAMAASVLLVIQTSSQLLPWKKDAPYTPLSSNSANTRANAAQFTLQFLDTATALEIQQLLRKYRLSVISGPSSVGLYKVSGPSDSIKNAIELLDQLKSHSDVVAHIQHDE